MRGKGEVDDRSAVGGACMPRPCGRWFPVGTHPRSQGHVRFFAFESCLVWFLASTGASRTHRSETEVIDQQWTTRFGPSTQRSITQPFPPCAVYKKAGTSSELRVRAAGPGGASYRARPNRPVGMGAAAEPTIDGQGFSLDPFESSRVNARRP
jgi:hypothetical protein